MRKAVQMPKLVFATRPSELARVQTRWIMEALQDSWDGLECAEIVIVTRGDRDSETPLPEIGAKGLFTAELEESLRRGAVDAAVHSLKDLPIETVDDIVLGAVPRRAAAQDVLVTAGGRTLAELPPGSVVGTSSQRRRSQLLAFRSDLIVRPIRGNVGTRVEKVLNGAYDAVILAAAGLQRLGLSNHITQHLPLEIMLPAAGQGALAVQCRSNDSLTQRYLAALDDRPTRLAVAAERTFLHALGGGCSLPVAAYAIVETDEIFMRGAVASTDGSRIVRVEGYARDPHDLGWKLAREAVSAGALEVLNAGT